MGYEQGKQGVACLDMPIAPWKGNFWFLGLFPNLECQGHLHPMQGVNLIFLGAPAFGRFDF